MEKSIVRRYSVIPNNVKHRMRVLKLREGLSYKEIGEKVGASESTARRYACDKYWRDEKRAGLDFLIRYDIDDKFRASYPTIAEIIEQIQEGKGFWEIEKLKIEIDV